MSVEDPAVDPVREPQNPSEGNPLPDEDEGDNDVSSGEE
jgi:hypothetical protein